MREEEKLVRKFLFPYYSPAPEEVGPCFPRLTCPICDEWIGVYDDSEGDPKAIKAAQLKLRHKASCYWATHKLWR